jgi:redox-sensitive bicupin YhaK (pirin superfamily)
MWNVRKSEDRGHANHGWLDTYYSFSFADYYDPANMGFRSLRVINADRVAPGGGFPTHAHRDMEIITYILEGSLEHKDSMGNGRVIKAGEFQYMAAGTGVRHSEFNPSKTEPVHLLQIWIVPERQGLPPAYAERSAVDSGVGKAWLVASATGRDGSIKINQDTNLSLARATPGTVITQPLTPVRHVWMHVAEGRIAVNGQDLASGDSLSGTGETELKFEAREPSQVLIFDLA